MEKCKTEYTKTEDIEVPFMEQIKYVGGTQWVITKILQMRIRNLVI
jgi:hypothetical protein